MPKKLPEPSRIEFHGPGPFDLPVAQSVAAIPVDNTVVLTFRVLARSNHLEVVRSRISLRLAADGWMGRCPTNCTARRLPRESAAKTICPYSRRLDQWWRIGESDMKISLWMLFLSGLALAIGCNKPPELTNGSAGDGAAANTDDDGNRGHTHEGDDALVWQRSDLEYEGYVISL